jgi:hypothetical protein
MGRARVARGSGVPAPTPPDIPSPPASGFGQVGFERLAGFNEFCFSSENILIHKITATHSSQSNAFGQKERPKSRPYRSFGS